MAVGLGRQTIVTDIQTGLAAINDNVNYPKLTPLKKDEHILYGTRAPEDIKSVDTLDQNYVVYVGLGRGTATFSDIAEGQALYQDIIFTCITKGDLGVDDAKAVDALVEEVEGYLLNLANKTLSCGACWIGDDSHPWEVAPVDPVRGSGGFVHARYLVVTFKIDGTIGVP